MVTDKDRMIEWLTRAADQIYDLRRKPRLSTDKCLTVIRQNYSVLSVLIEVANGKAKMQGISPPDV
jgi:hypothetical protein